MIGEDEPDPNPPAGGPVRRQWMLESPRAICCVMSRKYLSSSGVGLGVGLVAGGVMEGEGVLVGMVGGGSVEKTIVESGWLVAAYGHGLSVLVATGYIVAWLSLDGISVTVLFVLEYRAIAHPH